jgi:hypothetical protein
VHKRAEQADEHAFDDVLLASVLRLDEAIDVDKKESLLLTDAYEDGEDEAAALEDGTPEDVNPEDKASTCGASADEDEDVTPVPVPAHEATVSGEPELSMPLAEEEKDLANVARWGMTRQT